MPLPVAVFGEGDFFILRASGESMIDAGIHDSYQINTTSIDAENDKSMREVYGLDKTLRE